MDKSMPSFHHGTRLRVVQQYRLCTTCCTERETYSMGEHDTHHGGEKQHDVLHGDGSC